MPSLALCMIIRNAEKTIEPCLKSVRQFVDEIVIVDTGSTDRTKDIIYTVTGLPGPKAHILDFTPATHPQGFLFDSASVYEPELGPFTEKPFLGDFGAARQFGWQGARSDYLMWIDADDIVDGGDKLASVLADMESNHIDTAFLNYDYLTDDRGRTIIKNQRERIFRRAAGAAWVGRVHEVCIPPGPSKLYSEINIVHKRREYGLMPEVANRNLKILIPWRKSQPDPPDPRILYYLACEERGIWPLRALADFRHYVSISGSPTERATAHLYAGEVHEGADNHDAALAEFALAAMADPGNPDGLFGAARIASYKARKGHVSWNEVIDRTERGLALTRENAPTFIAINPTERASRPYIYYSAALVETQQYQKGIKAAEEGLKFYTSGDPYKWLTHNLAVCRDRLNPNKIDLKFKRNEPLDTPAQDIQPDVLRFFATQVWKKIRDSGDLDRAKRLLECLPDELTPVASAPSVALAAGKLDIVIWTGPGWNKWSPKTLETGLGGSETAAINMARELAKLGHRVRVYSDCGDAAGNYEGVEYFHYNQSHEFECDVLVVSRLPAALVDYGNKAKLKVLWVHDVHCGEGVTTGLGRADMIFCLSEWHKDFFLRSYPFLDANRVHVTRNGIDLERFVVTPKKIGNRLIYSSSADRGLLRLLELFPRIRTGVPDAELHVYYGFETWETTARLSNDTDSLARIAEFKRLLAETPGVVFHGNVGQQELADAFLASKVWAMPTWFTETSCISAMEAQAAGCIPVTTALAALNETVKHGILIQPPENSEAYGVQFVSYVTAILTGWETYSEMRTAGRAHALANLGWGGVAASWDKVFRARKVLSNVAVLASLKITFICGKCSTGLHGKIDAERLFKERALTGSESSFFNIARGLSELGHEVTVFCDVLKPLDRCEKLAGARVRHIDEPFPGDQDAYVSLNEPDQFRRLPENVHGLRIVQQQLNDFPYCQEGFEKFVDIFAFLSPVHKTHVLEVTPQIDPRKTWWIPNSINLEFFDEWKDEIRIPHSAAWCSSPDRGLHRLLEIWPVIRQRVPDATLNIFYRFEPWYEAFKYHDNEIGARARLIRMALDALEGSGVHLVGPVPNHQLAKILRQTDVLPYTCDTISFTEGFSVAIMDACAAGAVPVISDTDAIGDIYKNVAHVVPGKVGDKKNEWVEAVVRAMTDEPFKKEIRARARLFAERFTRQNVSKLWETLISSKLDTTRLPATIQSYAVPAEVVIRTPKVTVLLGSNRPGGIDIALAGLVNQTFNDFEVVFVDGHYHERHARVLEAVRQSGLKQPFFHVPNHRYSNTIWGTTCAGYNTGFMLAAGEIVVMLLDYAYAPPTWLDEHVRHQREPKIVMGPHEYRTITDASIRHKVPVIRFDQALVDAMPPQTAIDAILHQRQRFDEISIFEKPFTPDQLGAFPVEESEVKCRMGTGPSDYRVFNTKNESFPLEAILDINGMDENYDRGRGPGDPDLGLRLSRKSLAAWVVHEAVVHCLNPRAIFPNLNLIVHEDSRLPPPHHERWHVKDGCAYFNQVEADSELRRAPNPFDIREERQRIWHWRDLSQEEKAILPRIVIPDGDYYP